MKAQLYFMQALSPLHAGTGQGVGVIDLPIAREKATDFPYVPGSSVKGVLRDACSADDELRTKIFGPETNNASEHAGSVQIADARLLLLPVRSLAGTFAWVTAPLILQRLLRDAQDAGLENLPPASVPIPEPATDEERFCTVAKAGVITLQASGNRHAVYLEDIDLIANATDAASDWADWIANAVFPGEDDTWRDLLAARFCVVDDDVFSFLLQTATEVVARIKLLDDAKTVEKGGLWYEESLPAETILSGLVMATYVPKADVSPTSALGTIAKLTESVIQVGGKATVGRGLCRIRLFAGDAS